MNIIYQIDIFDRRGKKVLILGWFFFVENSKYFRSPFLSADNIQKPKANRKK